MEKITAKVNEAFGVSKTKTTGSGKNAKTTARETETYYKEVYTAASEYLKNLEVTQKASASQEVQYWKAVKASLKERNAGLVQRGKRPESRTEKDQDREDENTMTRWSPGRRKVRGPPADTGTDE